MIRVAWQVPNTPDWIGGLNYFRNLLEALLALPDRRIEPVILGNAAGLPEPFNRCKSLPWPPPPIPEGSFAARKRRFEKKHFDTDENGGYPPRYLASNKIRLLSHGDWLGKGSPVPALCWIPDFQHRHLPSFFSAHEIEVRDTVHAQIADLAQAVLLSSEDARKDFCRFHPEAADKACVLRFVSNSPDASTLPPTDSVLRKHGVSEPFFYVPNQLWAHKNHGIVIEALGRLAAQGCRPLVLSTGTTNDYRNPEYFATLCARLEKAGLSDRLRFLGLVPYSEVAVLMRKAVALINPSLFEGWSTTVEEAKSLGKRLILSDLAVHREQAPARSLFFDPHNPDELASKMVEVLKSYDPEVEFRELESAVQKIPERLRDYARTYEDIVLSVIAKCKKRWWALR